LNRRRIPLGRFIWQPILRFLIWLFARVTVRNTGLVPRDGAGIIYYNHIHWLDPPLICAISPRYAVPLTKVEASHWPLVGSLLRWYHVIFITRGVVDRTALKATWEILDAGDISVISPEGTRSLDGRLQAAKEGLAFIAHHNPDCWLMPCGVTGTPAFDFKHFWRRPPLTLTYGRPFRFCWPGGKASREMQSAMADEAMTQFLPLLPPQMHGDYAGRDPSAVRWLEFLA
jgi:1-acyl-sn-glycerol-3-phosphate acyltransferase